MGKKRKKPNRRRQEVRVPFPTILVGVLTLSVVIGAGYMSINIRCSGLGKQINCLLYTSPSPRDSALSRMPSSA